jgi:hypothetical protein
MRRLWPASRRPPRYKSVRSQGRQGKLDPPWSGDARPRERERERERVRSSSSRRSYGPWVTNRPDEVADQRLLMPYGASEEPRRQMQQSTFRPLRSASSPKRPPRHTQPGLGAWDGDPCDAVSFLSAQVPRLRSHSRRAHPAPAGHPYIGSSPPPSPWDQSPCRSDRTQERLCGPWESFLEVLGVYGPAPTVPWYSRVGLSSCW